VPIENATAGDPNGLNLQLTVKSGSKLINIQITYTLIVRERRVRG